MVFRAVRAEGSQDSCHHYGNLPSVGQVELPYATVFISVRIKGAISGCLQGKNPWRPAPALTVVEVLHLRVIANDDAIDLVDRAGAAHFLAMLYGRCRASDIQEVSDLCWDKASEDSWSQGFIECRTLRHKTARLDERKKRLLPIVIPGRGIASKDFGDTLKQVRDLAGLPNQLDKVPLLPVPREDNTWSDDALESAEISRWLQALLPRPQDHLMSHSLKATVLLRGCKFGLSRETRRILGRHADAVGGSDAVYGRDVQAQALRELEVVLEAVRLGHFRPDATRSGLFALNFSRDSLLQQAACQVPNLLRALKERRLLFKGPCLSRSHRMQVGKIMLRNNFNQATRTFFFPQWGKTFLFRSFCLNRVQSCPFPLTMSTCVDKTTQLSSVGRPILIPIFHHLPSMP